MRQLFISFAFICKQIFQHNERRIQFLVGKCINLLVVVSLLLSAVGFSSATPASAAAIAAQPAGVTDKQPEKNSYDGTPLPTRPAARTATPDASATPDPRIGFIACGSTATGADAALGCDHVYAKTLHLHDSGPGTNMTYNISDPGDNPVYFTISATYTLTYSHPLNYLNNGLASSFGWEVNNPLVGTTASDNSGGKLSAGTYTYKGSGKFSPSWWHAFGFHYTVDGLWPYDGRKIDSVDITISVNPLDGVPVESSKCKDCSAGGQAQNQVGDPINTHTGNFHLPVVDLSVPTTGGELSFERDYDSLEKSRDTTVLSPGWSHNQDIRLIFPNDPAGTAGYVLFKSPSSNMFRFVDQGNGVYTPYSGTLGTLTRNPAGDAIAYSLRDNEQNVYSFDLAACRRSKYFCKGKSKSGTNWALILANGARSSVMQGF